MLLPIAHLHHIRIAVWNTNTVHWILWRRFPLIKRHRIIRTRCLGVLVLPDTMHPSFYILSIRVHLGGPVLVYPRVVVSVSIEVHVFEVILNIKSAAPIVDLSFR